MKNELSLALLFFILLINNSCSEEKPIGHWRIAMSSLNSEYPFTLDFTEDSIRLRHPYFNTKRTYKLNKLRGKNKFNNSQWDVTIDEDILIINNRIKYFKTDYNPYLPKLELPNISKNSLFQKKPINETSMLMAYMFKENDSKPLIKVNEDFITLSDIQVNLIEFFSGSLHGPRPNIFFFIDKSMKMQDVEKLFFEILESNILKLHLVNSINFSDINRSFDEYIHIWEYEILDCNLHPIDINKQYYQKINNGNLPPPPPPVPNVEFHNSEVIELDLQDNQYFFEDQIISEENLISIVNAAIDNEKKIFSTYSLESSYKDFLEFNAIIRSVYRNKRNALSNKTFGKDYENLDNSDKWGIRNSIPLFHFWQFSQNYFDEVITNPDVESTIKIYNSEIPKPIN